MNQMCCAAVLNDKWWVRCTSELTVLNSNTAGYVTRLSECSIGCLINSVYEAQPPHTRGFTLGAALMPPNNKSFEQTMKPKTGTK
jgi:hypothetical protein